MRGTEKKRAAFVVALSGVWALSGATVWAQISPGFANTVQQNLATRRQAEEVARSSSVPESAPRAPLAPAVPRRAEAASVGRVEALFIAAQNYDGVAWAYVTEKNDASLGEEAGWVALDKLTWDFSVVANGVNASKLRPNYSSALRVEVSPRRSPRLDAPLKNAPSRFDSVAPGDGPRPSRVLPRF